jgi:7-cyano-7-deazaguanine reductase
MKQKDPNPKQLEAVKNEYINRNYVIKVSIPEFTCACPRTGQPDFATIEIIYTPNQSIVELKSLKLYMQRYRDIGMFHENVVNKILEDFDAAAKPRKLKIIGSFNPRGGISTIVEASL